MSQNLFGNMGKVDDGTVRDRATDELWEMLKLEEEAERRRQEAQKQRLDAAKEALIQSLELESKREKKEQAWQALRLETLKKEAAKEEANWKKKQEKWDKYTEDQREQLKKDHEEELHRIAERARAEMTTAEKVSAIKKQAGEAVKKALVDGSKALGNTIEAIARSMSEVDTRLQGGNLRWNAIQKNMVGRLGMSPFLKQEDYANNVKSMVSRGIAYNVEERAFLETIKDKIAGTFETASDTLTKLVRIQQQDTTASRLGMESALTSFLNNMYETTEYMQSAAQSIKGTLFEAESLMSAEGAAAMEYQVQKWMGSLYSVGANSETVSGIASAFGQLAAGQIEGLSGNYGKLLAVAAANGGVNLTDALKNGLDDSETNKLLASMTSYLGNIYEETKNNNVVAQEYAKVFGLKASDLKAIGNLQGSYSDIASNGLTYSGMLDRLNSMAMTMNKRMSAGELISNATSNLKYSLASGVASNPALYGTYLAAGMLDDVLKGIQIPTAMVLGTGVDTKMTVADYLRMGALGAGALNSIGQIIASGNGEAVGGMRMKGVLNSFGIGNGTVVSRGNGIFSSGEVVGGWGTGESSTISNTDETAMTSYGFEQNNNQVNDTLGTAVGEDAIELKDVNSSVKEIFGLLSDVINGSSTFKVSIDYYQSNLG